MSDHSTSLSLATALLEQSRQRAIKGLAPDELQRLRAALKKTLVAVDACLAETRAEEILDLLPELTGNSARYDT